MRHVGSWVLFIAAAMLFGEDSAAALFTVLNLSDTGAGSLRDAITQANAVVGVDTIQFQPGLAGTISLASPLPHLAEDVTIVGPGAGVVTISGSSATNVMIVDIGVAASVSGLTIADGALGGGAGINNAGTLTVDRCVFANNHAPGDGGGISNYFGSLTVTNSTFTGNSAGNIGGGIYNGGIATIVNSTFTGNQAGNRGGGIENTGTATISFSTFRGNGAVNSGGNIGSPRTLHIKNSIAADSTASGDCFIGGGAFAEGVNFDTDGTCTDLIDDFTTVTSAMLNLGPLALNAPGQTPTHALLMGSVAIDAAVDCTDRDGNTVAADQRGLARPVRTACDVGAYEYVPAIVNPVPTLSALALASLALFLGGAAVAWGRRGITGRGERNEWGEEERMGSEL